jgi:hypothetical protein
MDKKMRQTVMQRLAAVAFLTALEPVCEDLLSLLKKVEVSMLGPVYATPPWHPRQVNVVAVAGGVSQGHASAPATMG